MTVEQQKAIERLERYIQREQLVSFMNDTKWSRLQTEMARVQPAQPQYRVKCLQDSEPSGWERDWSTHLPLYKWIEWVDIDPVYRERRGVLVPDLERDRSSELIDLLHEHSIPYELDSGYIRVYGYRRTAG